MEEECRWAKSSLAILSLVTLIATTEAGLDQDHPLRFWMDEYAFSQGETTILRERIQDVGTSVAQLAGESDGSLMHEKGYYNPQLWDVYWTGRQGCMMALPYVIPGHKVSCVPGLHELTLKDRLVARLTQFYGEGAFRIIPRSYLLPTQYWNWRLWLAAKNPAKRGDMWVLKKEVHRGKGVHVLPLRTAIRDGKKMEEMYDVVQKYIGNQMTVLGRKFYVRLWAVVTSSFPLRAYLYDGGVVVFGNTSPEDKAKMTSDDYIVNLWHLGRNTEARPWSMSEFKTYLDNLTGCRKTYDNLWLEMRRSLGLTFAAGVQSMRFSAAQFPVAAASATFEMVGIDFLVDEHMKPWLLEVNAVPSMARKVINCDKQPEGCTGGGEAESVFDVEKERFVHSLFNLLRATAGVNLTEQARLMNHKSTNLAEFLAKWKTNATDLALLKQSAEANNTQLYSQLGWSGKDAAPPKTQPATKGLDLQNSGRELRTAETQPASLPSSQPVLSSSENSASSSSTPGEDMQLERNAPGELHEGKDAGGLDAGSAQTDENSEQINPPALDEISASPVHRASRAQTVGDATNLNKYVDDIAPRLDTATKEEHDRILEEHLLEVSIRELNVAVENHFLPLMMIPEAVDYSVNHQSRGLIHPLPAHKSSHTEDGHSSRFSALFNPLTPVLGAYGGLAQMVERLRLGIVAIAPEVNLDVTINVARNIPGADWLILQMYKLFSYGDCKGTVEAFSVLPKHRIDQRLSDHIKTLSLEF